MSHTVKIGITSYANIKANTIAIAQLAEMTGRKASNLSRAKQIQVPKHSQFCRGVVRRRETSIAEYSVAPRAMRFAGGVFMMLRLSAWSLMTV